MNERCSKCGYWKTNGLGEWYCTTDFPCVYSDNYQTVKSKDKPKEKHKEQTIKGIIESVCGEVCMNLCKYIDTTDHSGLCEYIREKGSCPLDRLQ